MNAVLIIAPQDDFHAHAVAREIEAAGGRPYIVERAAYPGGWQISFCLDDSAIRFQVDIGSIRLTEYDIAGVWWRRPATRQPSTTIADDEVGAFAFREAEALLHGFLYALDRRVLNPLAAQTRASRKLYQLAVAQSCGLRIPKTAITTRPEEAIAFREALNGPAVFKILTHAPGYKLIETRPFLPEHDDMLATLILAPAIFQEAIDKVHDLRVTVIDNQCFAVRCTCPDPAVLDWRIGGQVEYEPWLLPPAVASKLQELQRRLGLRYGAIDLGVTAAGDHVFFETNVAGQFLFGEIDAGHPICATLAQALLYPPS